MKKLAGIFILSTALFSGCSSTKTERELEEREHENLKRDYEVIDASSKFRPGWIEEATLWAKEYGKKTTSHRFFSYETDAKGRRSVACQIAKARLRGEVAAEISTQIKSSLQTVMEGDSSSSTGVSEALSSELRQTVETGLHGLSVVKTYWEKRFFQKDLGANKDLKLFTCASLGRIEKKMLRKSYEAARKLLLEKRRSLNASREDITRAIGQAEKSL